MQKIVTNLWFDTEAEEAAKYYCSIFKDSRIVNKLHYGEAGPRDAGMVLTVDFELDGQMFTAINGGPEFKFTEAISLLVNCETQEELDGLWETLLQGGEPSACGWLKDKYGLSWQITPVALEEMLRDPNPVKSQAVMRAMLQMVKIDLPALEQVYRAA